MSRAATGTRTVWLSVLALSAFAPLVVLLIRSVSREWFFPALLPQTAALGSWSHLLSGRLGASLLTSLSLGAATGALAAVAGFPVGRAMDSLVGWRRSAAAGCAFLPIAVPPIALATGLHVTILSAGLGGTWTGVLIAHFVPALGYASLFFLGIFAAYDRRLENEARALGASRRQVLAYVTLPMLRRPIVEVALLAFLVSWAQVPLTLLIGGGAVRTLPVEVLGYVQAGQDRYAATGALLLVLPALAMVAAATLAARRTETVAV